METLQPLPDGRWTEADHVPTGIASLWCRGNTGEVYPNVMTPMSSSLFLPNVSKGQASAAMELGMVTSQQMKRFNPYEAWSTGVFGGYLYANVTMARAVASRTPGLSVAMVDEQMFGLNDAPPHVRQKGEIELRPIVRTIVMMAKILRAPNDAELKQDQKDIAVYAASAPDITTATEAQLLACAESAGPWADRMMRALLFRSANAGIARGILEQLVAKLGDADLVNRLTAGLGTIESAEPASELWQLGRLVHASPALTAAFDRHVGAPVALETALRADNSDSALAFVREFDTFRSRHAARGPDEWELASPTWSSDPSIAIGMIDRLRHAPVERDPVVTSRRLATEASELAQLTRARLPKIVRPVFDKTMRSVAEYSAQREATKAAFMRAMLPARNALAELARRSAFSHPDFFLLRFDEIAAALKNPDAFRETIDQRRVRRDFLQARVPPFWFEGPPIDPNEWSLRSAQRVVDTSARTLSGMAVCSGTATGPARVITDPSDPRGIEPGDILVAPLTDPAWTPLFLSAAGVVVDVGAQQSHASIVARELGIPAVVSVTGASTTIPDGARITVDGSAGTVTVH